MASQERFRFEPGDEEPELTLPDEELKRRVKRLSQRISFLTLLLPCLIAIVIYVAYRDLVLRVNYRQNTELQSVERLVQDIEQKIGSLNQRLSDMEAALAKLGDFEKSLQARQEELRKSEATLEKISVAKADKKDIEENLQRFEEGLAAVNKNVQGLSRELQALAPFREELGASASLRSEIQGLSARLQKLETSLGKDLTGRSVTLRVRLTGPADEEFHGQVTFVGTEVQPTTGQVNFWAEIENRDMLLRPGLKGSLTIGPSPSP